MTDTSRLGGGSIVEVNGVLYIKTEVGKLWQVLAPDGLPCRLPGTTWGGVVDVIRETEWNPLGGYAIGTVITYDDGEVAKKTGTALWEAIGHTGELYTEELLDMIEDKDSLRVLT